MLTDAHCRNAKPREKLFVLARKSTKNVAAGLDFARNRARRRGDNEWSMRPACTL